MSQKESKLHLGEGCHIKVKTIHTMTTLNVIEGREMVTVLLTAEQVSELIEILTASIEL